MANVLLVDPDDIAFLALKGFLARGNHRCASVSSQEEAIEFLRTNLLVDLVIVELKLVESTGLGLVRNWRNDFFFRSIPVVFCAAKTTPEEIRQAFSLTVQNFLRKPYQEETLREEVEKAAAKRWYWEGFESDEDFIKRTKQDVAGRRAAMEAAMPVLQSTRADVRQSVDLMMQVAGMSKEQQKEEKERLLGEFFNLRSIAEKTGTPGLGACLAFFEDRVRSGSWAELKYSVDALDFYAELMSYRVDMYELDLKTQQASALLDRLGRNAVLRSLPPTEVHALIPHVRDYHIQDGVTLFKQGDAGDAMYLIDRGRLGVYIQMPGEVEPRRIAEIGDGDIVGEMALINGAPRSATIIAQSDVHAMRVEKADFDRVLMMSPEMKRAVQALAAQRNMDSIKKKAGEIDISAWAKSAGDEYRKMGERVPKGFLAVEEADAKREAANIALWNHALDKQLYPVVKAKAMFKGLEGLNSIPVSESATAAFALAANGTEASLHPLMDLAEKDPGLALQVLQLSNEVRQAKRKDLTTFLEDVRMGVGYLGEKRLSAMARAMPRVRESLMYVSEEENWTSHLQFLTATGMIAQMACQQMELPDLEHIAFVAGLTHDIGKLLLMNLQPAAFLHIFQYAQQNKVPVWESEMLHLEVTSRQLAVEFMKDRPFPARIKNVVRWVEKPEVAEEDLDLVSVVAVARHMCRLCKVGFSGESHFRDLLPLEHTQLWNSIRHRIFPSFNVAKFEVMVRNKCREIVTGKSVL